MPPHKGQIYKSKPGPPRGTIYQSLSDRFHAKVEKLDTGCWRFTGHIARHGYGMLYLGRVDGKSKITVAHRIAYELYKGPIPEGLILDHLCRNRWCVNPDHLEPVTFAENIHRGEAPGVVIHLSGKCKRGHEMTPENTYRLKSGYRSCRTCQIEYHKAERRRKREAKAQGGTI